MKTNQLTGTALDWAVAKCKYPELVWGSSIGIHHASHQIVIPHLPEPQCYWNPTTDWAQGGPIIEIMGMGITRTNKTNEEPWAACVAQYPSADIYLHGATPLVAAMRCYVAYRWGDEVDVPEELR